ncbi:hypothetical protein HY990_01270 [Candidatus Micrarchaeota archaeon]|nr:hypothetical protein [Candidatus Micrarchaeota archaeon]
MVGFLTSASQLYSLLLARLDPSDIELRVSLKIKQHHGLVNRTGALRLLCLESGLLTEILSISSLSTDNSNLGGNLYVEKLWPTSSTSSGTLSRVVVLTDKKKSISLVLWAKDTEIVSSFRCGDLVSISGAFKSGDELFLSKVGKITLLQKSPVLSDLRIFSDPLETSTLSEPFHLIAPIHEVTGFISSPHAGFLFSLGSNDRSVSVLITQNSSRGQRLSSGSTVLLENCIFDKSSGKILLNMFSRIFVKKIVSTDSSGIITDLRFVSSDSGDQLVVLISGQEYGADRQTALRLFGLDVADDISLATLAFLKRESLLNTQMSVKCEKKDGKLFFVV